MIMSSKTLPYSVFLILGFCVLALYLLFAFDEPLIPSDFRVVATYSRGYSDWSSWETTISKDGRTTQVDLTNDLKKEISLSRKDLVEILKALKKDRFFDLEKAYSVDVSDNPTLVLSITSDGRTHEVVVYAPVHQVENEDVKRFFKIWDIILAKVPSPNREQKPGYYDRAD